MHFSTPFLILTAVANLALGSFVYLRNPKLAYSKYFAVLSVSVAAWSIGLIGFYEFSEIPMIKFSAEVFYIAALLMNASLLSFTAYFLQLRHRRLYALASGVSWAFVSFVITLSSDLLFTIGSKLEYGAEVNLVPGTYIIYTALVLGYYTLTLWVLLKQKDSKDKSSPDKRNQIRFIILGLLIAGIFASMFNVILPGLSVYDYVWMGPLFTAAFVASVGYAVVKHKLFDVRAAVARVMTYVFTSGVLIGVYAGGAYFLGALVVGLGASKYQVMVNIGLTAVLILVYPSLKRTFDKFTNRVFFREAYDAQTFIDELNKTLVSGIELDTLLTKSALIIQENMKSAYCTFYIRETSYLPPRMLGAHRDKTDFADIEVISEHSKHLKTKVFDAETLHEEPECKKLAEELKKNDAAMLVRLVDTTDYEVNGIGYIFIGPKRSGGLYSKKDFKILEIIANELVVAVESALRFEEIEQFNVTLQKKIDDATQELRRSNEKLQALDAAKDEFISMASHQLRTPLTSVKGYISMVMDGDLGEVSEQQKKMLDQAFISSQRMVYLIADLLNVSRLRTGKFSIEVHPTNLAEVIKSEISQLQGAAEARNLKLNFKKPAKFPQLMLDETKIRQVVMNFVDNAIYYTPSGGSITVNLKLTKTSLEVTVVDTGMGVPKKEVPRLFTKFYRAGNAKQARPDGTGIGLFMAKKVIVASGGSIVFKTKENKGSTFGFLLPLSKIKVPEKD